MFSYLEGIDTIVLSGEFAQTRRIFYKNIEELILICLEFSVYFFVYLSGN